MKPIYSKRAVADLDEISAYYISVAGRSVAQTIGQRLDEVIDRVCLVPRAAPFVSQRSNIRSVPLVNYPFRIFYRIRRGDVIEVVHIRHTARRAVYRV